jgi:RNA polymerase sigma-54 factor
MAISIKQSLNLSQQLVMTPQLQQAIKLLQLSRMELENLINTELVDNPALEESMESESTAQSLDDMETTTTGSVEENPQTSENFNWENYIENSKSSPTLPVYRNQDEELPSYENTLTSPTSLADHLLWQLKMNIELDDKQKAMGEVIIGNINEDGYLPITLDEIAQKENYDVHELEVVLYNIQGFDPIGVGARDLKECLLVQLDDSGLGDEHIERIIENHLPDLERKNYTPICKALGLSLDLVGALSPCGRILEPSSSFVKTCHKSTSAPLANIWSRYFG